ncbi:endogenous retrovirus group K member 5 Gag polyprotein-like [Melospiza georgiana]|uniref:endogenous retrovirus group K member 5 Gag polyprotein-like n=1 Tax=Melospiza georgiana TaxID=44398 RepID=UPI0025AB8E3C|nr:endogenous retrovirus group K member 5 Gag polyprotein-like [Melospiza georgiana]
MGQNLSKEEESVLSTWKVLLRNKGINTSDYELRNILLWAKSQNFGTDPKTAFSVKAWKKVGDRLWQVIRVGDKTAVDLAVTWNSLFEALKEWRIERETEQDADEESGLISDGGAEVEGGSDGELGEESSDAMGVTRHAARASGKAAKASGKAARASGLGAKASGKAAKASGKAAKTSGQPALASSYQTPKPPYLTPAQQLKMVPVYTTPLLQVAEMSLAERKVQPSAPPLPSSLVQPSAPPLPSEMLEQPARPYPPLPDSDNNSESSDESPAVTPELGHGALVSSSPKSSSLTAPWTLPPCQVTVLPRHPQEFWEFVRRKAVEEKNWDIIERLGAPRVPQENSAIANVACDNPMAFPVFKAVPGTGQNDSHHVFAWRVVQDLQSKVAQYGINSSEVMQLIRVINADLLAPYDITHLATILFQPVQYGVFQETWRRVAERTALTNMQLPQHDPRHAVGVDALMGSGPFANPDLQARWDPSILAQAQQIGMSALTKTMEMAAPKQKYVTIQQGTREPFLQFAEKLAAAIEKQVDDETLRDKLCVQLAKENANPDCRKIIDTLPGEPTLSEMVTACSKVGSVEHKMAALAAVLRPSAKCYNCGQQGHVKSQCTVQKTTFRPSASSDVVCNRCGKSGHYAKQCRSRYHVNGQLLPGNPKRSAKGRVGKQIPQQPQQQMRAFPALQSYSFANNTQGQQAGPQGLIYPPLTQ